MNEIMYTLLVFICGIMLGIIFFGGLWLTIKRGLTSKIPGLLFISSFLIRTGFVLIGFYLLASDNWKNIIACLLGFILARLITKQVTKPQKEKARIAKEVSHET